MSTPPPITTRLTPQEFKEEVLKRGWTFVALSKRWDITPNWVSKVCRNEGRALHWDDAVRGLPYITEKA